MVSEVNKEEGKPGRISGSDRVTVGSKSQGDLEKDEVLSFPEGVVHNIKEAGCYGAAMLACSYSEKMPVEQLINTLNTENEIFSPNPENAEFYENKFKTYKQLYPVLKQFWKV